MNTYIYIYIYTHTHTQTCIYIIYIYIYIRKKFFSFFVVGPKREKSKYFNKNWST